MSQPKLPKKPSRWDPLLEYGRSIVQKIGQDNLPRLASSFSFFALLSFAPFLVFAVTVASMLLGRNRAADHLLAQAAQVGGPQLRDYLHIVIQSSQKPTTSAIATSLSLCVTFFSASNLFMNLDDAVNWIWRKKSEGSFIKNLIVARIVAFFAVVLFGAILLAWLAMDMTLGYLARTNKDFPAWEPVSFLATIVFFTVAFSLILRSFPRDQLTFKDTVPGAIAIATGFAISKWLLSYYFGHLTGVYTAAGGVVVLLLWMYYSTIIYFVGVEITYVYSHRSGSLRDKAEEAPCLASNPALQTS